MEDVVIAIAYIHDKSQIKDNVLSFDKCTYVAIGKATGKQRWKPF